MSTEACLLVNIPGPKGATGAAGTNGVDGRNASTLTTAAFTMPAELGNVVVQVEDASWVVVNQFVFVGTAGGGSKGFFQVLAKASDTQITLTNLADTPLSAYLMNSPPGTVFAASARVSPAGPQGPDGVAGAGGAPADATYITQTPSAGLSAEQALSALGTGLMRSTTGTGVVDIVPLGVADQRVAPVDMGAGLTNGDVVFATAAGLETLADAAARTALGLGTMAVQNANNVNITGGVITGVTMPGPTSLFPKDLLIYEHQAAVSSGAFTLGAPQVVPLTTEVVDTGGYGSIAANTITLAAGTYRAFWTVPGYLVDRFQSWLLNVTAGLVLGYGSNGQAAATDATEGVSVGACRFTLAAPSQLRIMGQCEATNAASGFGQANTFGTTQVYSRIVLEREAS